MKEYTIGLDLGINNVGWAKYDLIEHKIIDKGVVRFKESSNAQERRQIRSSRRLNKRKHHRVERLAIYLKSINFNTQRSYEPELLDKRIKGLTEKLTEKEITNIIYYFAIHRGYIPFYDDNNDTTIYNNYEAEGIKYPCEYIKKTYQKKNRYRGLINGILLEDNMRELTAILEKQAEYYSQFTKNNINSIINIIESKREFWEGPGGPNENQLSIYGRYRTIEDLNKYAEDPSFHKYLFEILYGKDKLSMNHLGEMEQVATVTNFYAEEFDFLNDFINMKVKNPDDIELINRFKITPNGKFTKETIEEIKIKILKSKNFNFDKLLVDVLGVKNDALEGYRIDKNKKPEVSSFKYYRTIKKIFIEKNLTPYWLINDDKDEYNKIMYILNVCPSSGIIENMLEERYPNIKITSQELEVLKEIKQKYNNSITLKIKECHSLSEITLKKAINDMYKYDCEFNFMQLLKRLEYEKEYNEWFKNNYTSNEKYPFLIEDKYVDDIISNPQVKKTLRKAIKVINQTIIDEGEYPKFIVIESAKELNGQERRKQIEKQQAFEEKLRKQAEIILDENGLPKSEKNIRKIILWQETNGTCVYCDKPISINEFLETETEHILPLSDSMDNSYDNVTCSCSKCNRDKGKQTPYQYLLSNGYEQFKQRVHNKYQMSEKKINNLLFEGDISKYSVKFINRNLRDNAFASVALVKELKKFNEFLKFKTGIEIDIITAPGQVTHRIRECLKMTEKNRNYLYHHVVDAMILASLSDSYLGQILAKSQNDNTYWLTHKDKNHRDELIEYIKNTYIYLKNKDQISAFNNECIKMPDDNKDGLIKISHEVLRNPIRSFANSNYNKYLLINDQYYIINKIADIYKLEIIKKDGTSGADKKLLDTLFDENNKSQILLCEEKDPKLFKMLKNIYQKNLSSINPFVDECRYANGLNAEDDIDFNVLGLRKNNVKTGPIIKSLRYIEKVTTPYLKNDISTRRKNCLGEFIDSHKRINTYVGLDQLSQVYTKIYYSKTKNKFIFLPINAISYINGRLNEKDPYYLSNYQRLIENDEVVFISDIYCGEWVKIYKKNGKVFEGKFSSYDKNSNTIDIAISGVKNKPSFTATDQAIVIYKTDILGNKRVKVDSRNKI